MISWSFPGGSGVLSSSRDKCGPIALSLVAFLVAAMLLNLSKLIIVTIIVSRGTPIACFDAQIATTDVFVVLQSLSM